MLIQRRLEEGYRDDGFQHNKTKAIEGRGGIPLYTDFLAGNCLEQLRQSNNYQKFLDKIKSYM